MWQPRQRVAVEGEERSCHRRGGAIPRPREDHGVGRESGQRKPRQRQQIHREDRRSAEPQRGCGHQRWHNERLGECQRILRRIEDVSIEQVRRVPRQLVDNPRDDPFVQLRVAVVVAREDARAGRERPGVHDRQQHEQRTGGPVRTNHAAHGVLDAGAH